MLDSWCDFQNSYLNKFISLQDKDKTEHINQNHNLSKRYPKSCVQLAISQPRNVDFGYAIPLHEAARVNSCQMATALLGAKASVNRCNLRGATALHVAANRGHVKMIQILLNAGAEKDRNETNQTGEHILSCEMQLWIINRDAFFLQKHWGRVLFKKSALSTTALPTQCANTALLRHSHSSSNTVLPTQGFSTESFQHSPSNTALQLQSSNTALLTHPF